MWEIIKYNTDKNIQFFKNGKTKERIITPINIGNGRYIIKSILSNEGGFGVIYNAIDTRLGNRRVLIKALKYEDSIFLKYENDIDELISVIEKRRTDIKHEYETLVSMKKNEEARMPSVNDVVYDYCPMMHLKNVLPDSIYKNEPYIIMQMIYGENLGDYVTNQTKEEIMKRREYTDLREWELDILSYSLQIATILEGFHERIPISSGNIYRVYQDLKPQNIMLTDERFITLLDFGGMTIVLEDEYETKTNDSLGNPGVGTDGYRAPEVKSDKYLIDERIDIYSLGATMYHLLTGTPLNTIIINDFDRIPIENIEKYYHKVTCDIVRKCTELDRDKRYRNIQEVKKDILDAFKPVRMGIKN